MNNLLCKISNNNYFNKLTIYRKLVLMNTSKHYITENEININEITDSIILKCIIKRENEIISINRTKYKKILIDIWKSMTMRQILKNSEFNFKLSYENNQKFSWCEDLNISFQNKDTKETFKEILNMVKINKLSINLSIKLKTNKIIHLKIE